MSARRLPQVRNRVDELEQQLEEARAAFSALAAGQVDSITRSDGPVLLRAAQEALRNSEENFRALIEQLPDQVWVHRHGRVIYVNLNTLRTLGYASEDLIGRELIDLVVPEDRPGVAARIAAGCAIGETLPRYEVRLLRRDGAAVTFEISPRGVLFDGVPATLKVAHDVTHRKELEAQLVVADRMASLGMLAAGVAHEINNPLAWVIANLNFVAEELAEVKDRPVGAACGEALSEAMDGAQRVRGIVRDLKAFSRSEDGQRGPVDLHRLLDSTANMAANEIRHSARLVKDYSLAPLVVEGNESRLSQVFLNLLVNAAQAIPEGAADMNEIRLTTRREPDGRVLAEVRDTGPGMSPQVLARMFTPFFTTKPRGIGTGLGLSICHKIVGAHGGEIRVVSEEGKGSAFRVWLPAAAAQPEVAQPLRLAASGAQRGRVLVIDDEPLLRSALQRVLSRHHEVIAVGGGLEAMDLLATDQHFDVILCDLMMPQVSGAQFFEQLSVAHPELAPRVVFVSGGAFTDSARKFLDETPNLRLDKPFDVSQILAVITRLLARG
ncbi:MAG: ATP-binding protein [Archangium sp.]|nr:ATP-binding protein [Archangium sp.]